MAVTIKYDIKDVDTEKAAARLAQLHVEQVGRDKCIQILDEEFGYRFTRAQLDRLTKKEIYNNVKDEFYKSIQKQAVAKLKEGTSSLVPKILKALEEAIEKGNIQAIAQGLKILGIENAEPETKQAQQLTVVLPGAVKKDTRDVN